MQTLLPNLQHFFVAASETLSPTALISRKFGIKPNPEKAEQKRRLKQMTALNNMARDLETNHPGLAAELRHFANR